MHYHLQVWIIEHVNCRKDEERSSAKENYRINPNRLLIQVAQHSPAFVDCADSVDLFFNVKTILVRVEDTSQD